MFLKEYKVGFGYGNRLESAESLGSDLDDLISNCSVCVINTEYQDVEKFKYLSDLPDDLAARIEEDMAEFLRDAAAHEAERSAENQALVRSLNKEEI